MNIEIRDELVWELQAAMRDTDKAVGGTAQKRAESRLGAAIDGLVREMIQRVGELSTAKVEKEVT